MSDALSPYLDRIELKYGEAIYELSQQYMDAEARLVGLIESVYTLPIDTDIPQALRRTKSLFAFFWAEARLSRQISERKLSYLQSVFSEATIEVALSFVCHEKPFSSYLPKANMSSTAEAVDFSDGLTIIRIAPKVLPGLYVFGLGKLGGFDLNFSSDVDLVAFYDAETLPIGSMQGRADVCTRLLRRFTEVLSKTIDNEFVWRVDWRLRPNAASPLLVLAEDQAEAFYFFHSQPWHRLAMVKARPVAGDKKQAQYFLDALKPYMWRQNLDYAMVDEIYRLKDKINREHPSLKQQRQAGELHALNNVWGFDIKLGRGGIREIEFIANAMQLLWGGKKPSLRITETVPVLQSLMDLQLLPKEDGEALIKSYRYYRRIEDILQIIDNRQTQRLPTSEDAIEVLALLMKESSASIEAGLTAKREFVCRCFDGFFGGQFSVEAQSGMPVENSMSGKPSPSNNDAIASQPELFDWVELLPELQRDIWDAWSAGFRNYGASESQYSVLEPLFLKLASLIDRSNEDRAAAIIRFHEFFKQIPKGAQYLRLLVEQPYLANEVLLPILHSPHLRDLLSQSPHIVDFLLEPRPVRVSWRALDRAEQLEKILPEESRFVVVGDGYEIRLERIRRFVNEQIYGGCLDLLAGRIGSRQLSTSLTALAEHTLEIAVAAVNEDLNVEQAPIAIIAMGKLGMMAMAPKSDLDLIFVADTGVDTAFAVEYSRRLQHLMEIRTREGRAYEMDMRLRPSGRSGPPTVSIESFESYHLNHAKSWEHIALVASRVVFGSAEAVRRINALRAQVLNRPRDKEQFYFDAAKMLDRLRDQRIGLREKTALDVKLQAGGLMEADYYSACLCLLGETKPDDSSMPYDDMMSECYASFSAKPFGQDISQLSNAVSVLRSVQIWARLLGLDRADFKDVPEHYLATFCADFGVECRNQLAEKYNDLTKKVREAIDGMHAEFSKGRPESWEDWQELPVKWRAE